MIPFPGLKIEVVVNHQCLLGEGPVWDAKRKLIYWIDILRGEIHEYSPESENHRTIKTNEIIGSIGLCIDGNFITATNNGFAFIDRISGEKKTIISPESCLPGNRFNDGKCDPAGRFLAGTMSTSGKLKSGSLYALETDLSVTKKLEQISISNGMAWSPTNEVFYYIDTPTYEVTSYDYDKTSGKISNKKIVIKIPKNAGLPDGMTIDNEGMLWVAHWDGWQVSRWNPQTGRELFVITLPVKKVTSCAFAGENLQDLYITTASVGLTHDEKKAQPLAGSLFAIKNIGFSGMEGFEFAG
ncbi:SMP-30/gluconolactonase/LRE family protein [Ginsengibacter hankyongi]|uniref:Regucalcin n=1 Tax=Ginsengibacter hankyongi TaxID=2607284 RepID=A0A5J5IJ81_9BACT|nr:SMP-30/gluconolactonase/LRE family protein [Ginsengibacter hankyongi]KAA9038777.1 SMP-30/gluconolactonase/LRE family protein [Ginsengibacter hankyongi]